MTGRTTANLEFNQRCTCSKSCVILNHLRLSPVISLLLYNRKYRVSKLSALAVYRLV